MTTTSWRSRRLSSATRTVRGARRRTADAGTATAELATVIPALVVVTALCVSAVGAVAAHVRCLDAARAGARELARGEPVPAVRAAALTRAPSAEVRVRRLDGGLVAVEVRSRVPLLWRGGPSVSVGGEVVAASETTVIGSSP